MNIRYNEGMRETEPRDLRPEPRPLDPLVLTGADLDLLEHLLSPMELEMIRQAEQGHLPCPECQQPLLGLMMIAEEYEGVTLVCLGCGVCEY